MNKSFELCHFPVGMKLAQVLPLSKIKDHLSKENYRPVSILPTIFKIFERSLHDQLSSFTDENFNPFLSVFRKGFDCLRLLEYRRKAQGNQECVAAILMDLSKAFACLPHDLLISKLRTYGLPEGAVKLLRVTSRTGSAG